MSVRDFWGTSATNIYAVTDSVALHFDGASSSTVDIANTNNVRLLSVTGVGPNDITIGGEHTMFHFDGTAWHPIKTQIVADVAALWSSSTEIFAALTPSNAIEQLVRACASCGL